MPRTCGNCTLCCRVMAIDADDGTELSGNDSWCKHCVIGNGCAIYESRPKVCQKFTCAWIEGAFREEDRPDRSKILVSIGPVTTRTPAGEPFDVPALEFKECAPGAFDTPRFKRMFNQLAPGSTLPVAVAPFERGLNSMIYFRGEKQNRFKDPEFARAFEKELVRLSEEGG